MNIYLTLDYEIYFGEQHGSVTKCIIEPVNRLREISKRTGVLMTYFIDIGHVIALERNIPKFPELKIDLDLLIKNIKDLVNEGNDCQLHIHPHWETSTYKNKLESITKLPVNSFRAGGWCLQPFSKIKDVFIQTEIKIDSTVFPEGKSNSKYYFYDFTNCPKKSNWKFSNNLCEEDENGDFLELPISSYNYSPLFFWKLFLLGNLFPKNHKPLGDGKPMPSIGFRKKVLTKGGRFSANLEGYYVTKLPAIIKQNKNKGYQDTVILGHPKALTKFSLIKLEEQINKLKSKNSFMRFSDVKI